MTRGPGPDDGATGPDDSATDQGRSAPVLPPTPGQSLRAMWLYTLLRFALFFAVWGLLWLARVPSLLAAIIALVLSIPLSYILLRKPRERLAQNLEARVNARHSQRDRMDAKLSGDEPQD
ncbi:DUF4229 domain-containing protein [Jatrophihabitans lederbergiae]|uniref:DUF4229 domain-containing protein n=1 Tax=Jatrophihabitans lederbergiae TaxID=3075547 RepID=A0ABU2J895_9ACTN|nr:DUF4229 domain-containing protein [Jatrophihabitans sp. DSM 44399]MDT0260938.1 DUF4229 domain-containing protein [Jatrophihabitans sp. DSM 44399]